RRRRHLGVGEPREQEGYRLGMGALVDAVERLAAAAREELRDCLIRSDHQLLDERVRVRLALAPRSLVAAPPVEGERDLGALDTKGPAGEAAMAEVGRELVRDP